MQPGVAPLVMHAVVGALTQGMDCVAVNIGLKLFKMPVPIGVSYLPTPALIAVLWFPNTSYINPNRGVQSLKHPSPLTVLQSTWGKLRAPTKRPAGALSASTCPA